ncbi:DUF1767-domain-containing protein [Wolfiporia cocos MD-104 SS10]|uniref:RecQ-mediated genome instability protein 1 n=1 Tax=Wolfiporia cocos (strain MD-104) TaxID=742152 RepID=A0A2H3JU32_WOLCO|nr:DUF1767-domain-containing protein [Wolfiporia cocos MD-104 SS10]
MAPPPQVLQWIRRTYPKPQIDMEWLEDCYSWIQQEYHLNPATQMSDIIKHVDHQLLNSDLNDSMVPDTGLPSDVAELDKTIIRGPILVQIVSIMEIGHSAFNLQNVRQARLERVDVAGLAREEDEEDEGPIPSYPRSMLYFRLSDGSTILQAMEYRRLPGLTLGETNLGYKMILKDVKVRNGIAFLEPKCVVMKGHEVADLAALQDRDFARDLGFRLGRPIDPALEEPNGGAEPEPAAMPPQQQPQPQPNAPSHPPSPPAPAPSSANVPPPLAPTRHSPAEPLRSPLRELPSPSPPPSPGPSGARTYIHADDEDLPRRRKLPAPAPTTTAAVTHSRFFPPFSGSASGPGSGSGTGASLSPMRTLARERVLSPHRAAPVEVPDSDEEEIMNELHHRAGAGAGAGQGVGGRDTEHEHAPSSDYDFGEDGNFEDPAFLEDIERVEREALAHAQATQAGAERQSEVVAAVASTATSSNRAGRMVMASASTSTQRATIGATERAEETQQMAVQRPSQSHSASASTGARAASRSASVVDLGVISVDSDEDDKENVPVPTRRVRRRMTPGPSQQEVIELSD